MEQDKIKDILKLKWKDLNEIGETTVLIKEIESDVTTYLLVNLKIESGIFKGYVLGSSHNNFQFYTLHKNRWKRLFNGESVVWDEDKGMPRVEICIVINKEIEEWIKIK